MPTNQIPQLSELLDESRRLLVDVVRSPDRASGITMAAILDDLLSVLLQHAMIDDGAKVKVFLNRDFCSFSFKIDASYCLGLISKNECNDLNLIRKIRNDFAHSRKPVSFEDPHTKSRCSELSLAKVYWKQTEDEPADTKTLFISGSVVLANNLARRASKLVHPEVAGELDFDQEIVFAGGSAPEQKVQKT